MEELDGLTETPLEPQARQRKKKTGLWIGIGVGLVAALAGAAFLVGQMLNSPVKGNVTETTINRPGGVESYKEMEITMEKAAELPERRPEAMGPFNRVEDNSLYINALSEAAIQALIAGGGNLPPGMEGPELEIVVTKDTQIYRDVTSPQYDGEEGQVVQQKVEAIEVDDIKKAGMVIVWGRRQGDRMVADVVLVTG